MSSDTEHLDPFSLGTSEVSLLCVGIPSAPQSSVGWVSGETADKVELLLVPSCKWTLLSARLSSQVMSLHKI